MEGAAEGGLADAQTALGGYYNFGREGVAIDLPRARTWYAKAAAQGHAADGVDRPLGVRIHCVRL